MEDLEVVKKGKIAHYRERLDNTLASHNLTDEKKLETLVKDQILRSSEDKSRGYVDYVMKKRTAEVSNFLEMLRSASENNDASPDKIQHANWKLKQDTEEFRVMYREGPVGSPFHSLLVEGYIDAPLDVCLCVSWETALYPRWFPEMHIPTFKVLAAKSLQKVRIGEEISLVRVKLSWPLSSREAILHYFEFEYMEDDLIIVLMNAIPDVDNIQMETHGFTSEGIPEAGHIVRIDVVGGFALQKVSENRSYFRTIANMDIKLDFVPPWLINFISRQLIGSGFKFYQKTIASVSKGDEAFAKALKEPLYSRIREAIHSNNESNRNLETHIIQDYTTTNNVDQKTDEQDACREEDIKVPGNDHLIESCNEIEEEEIKESNNIQHDKILGDMFKAEDQTIHYNGHLNQYKPTSEIEEEEINENENMVVKGSDSTDKHQLVNFNKKVKLSPQVEHALGNLDKMISVVRECRFKAQGWAQSGPEIDGSDAKSSAIEKHVKWEDMVGTSRSSPAQNRPIAHWSRNSPSVGSSPVIASPTVLEVNNSTPEKNSVENKKSGQPKKWRICCFQLISGRLV